MTDTREDSATVKPQLDSYPLEPIRVEELYYQAIAGHDLTPLSVLSSNRTR
jgi:hypothetical protein